MESDIDPFSTHTLEQTKQRLFEVNYQLTLVTVALDVVFWLAYSLTAVHLGFDTSFVFWTSMLLFFCASVKFFAFLHTTFSSWEERIWKPLFHRFRQESNPFLFLTILVPSLVRDLIEVSALAFTFWYFGTVFSLTALVWFLGVYYLVLYPFRGFCVYRYYRIFRSYRVYESVRSFSRSLTDHE